MLPLSILIAAQAVGEALMEATRLPLPGPVAGALLLFCLMLASSKVYAAVEHFCRHIIKNMLVFYVPASVGIMEELPLLREHLAAIAITVAVSTLSVAIVSAVIFERLSPRRAP